MDGVFGTGEHGQWTRIYKFGTNNKRFLVTPTRFSTLLDEKSFEKRKENSPVQNKLGETKTAKIAIHVWLNWYT